MTLPVGLLLGYKYAAAGASLRESQIWPRMIMSISRGVSSRSSFSLGHVRGLPLMRAESSSGTDEPGREKIE
ncbi:MAG: hypothetical protein WBD41_26590 [Rhodococcus sp. (in: high G+C Gram-positive bacteria)]|jgi:hypothetical protein|uniref:hypothetical protein n=1 Tax=Rhodococcus sp. EPR-157 TaxID=1813677 RepID=UPI0007BAE176|nr:hypothetical protein [Rhodococcus sp. EPR-157]KZE99907.1 hypothetical protein A2J03_11075 [Rhodococcus sp. EPR-157]